MAETMSNVERALWRIAELGARCSQLDAAGGRGPLWAELEQTIAGLEAELEAARQARELHQPECDATAAQVRSLEGRLNVARKERDRERGRAQECYADAEAARRERDRERQKARKATAAANSAKATAAESVARVAAAEAAADQALAARDQAMAAFDQAVSDGEQAAAARDVALAALDDATARIALLEAALAAATTELGAAVAAEAAAAAERDEAVDSLAAQADTAVVVLPGVTLPDTPTEGPMNGAAARPETGRVSWQPTWSEWAQEAQEPPAPPAAAWSMPEAVVPEAVVPETVAAETVVELADDAAEDEVVLDDGDSVRRYLNVAATIGQLLPDDLGPYLLAGATVIRREGRLYATVAVTTNPWSGSGSDGAQQAQLFADAGFRVEWTSDAPLAC